MFLIKVTADQMVILISIWKMLGENSCKGTTRWLLPFLGLSLGNLKPGDMFLSLTNPCYRNQIFVDKFSNKSYRTTLPTSMPKIKNIVGYVYQENSKRETTSRKMI